MLPRCLVLWTFSHIFSMFQITFKQIYINSAILPGTKVKLTALPPAALTIGWEVRQKISNCQAAKKKQYFSQQWARKQYQKGWKPCSTRQITSQCKTHLQNKKTTPQSWPTKLKIDRFYPNFTQLVSQPTSTHFISPFLVFHTDSISVENSSNTFGNLEILYKM